jgi:hypothetical protein
MPTGLGSAGRAHKVNCRVWVKDLPELPRIYTGMTLFARKFGIWDVVVVGTGVTALFVLELMQPRPFGLEFKEPPPKTAEQALDDWRANAEGGAAFAMSRSGAYGWAYNHHKVDTAREFALARCRKHDPHGCRIVEERDESVFYAAFDQVVSPKTVRRFEHFLTLPGYKAFAINPEAAMGWSYRYKTKSGAMSGALAQCRAAAKPVPGVARGPCKVVYTGW